MKKKVIYLCLVLAFRGLQAQIGINTPTPRGALDINRPTTNTMGLVLPTNTSAESVINPLGGAVALGTTVYDSTKDCVRVYKSTGWSNCIGDTNNNGGGSGTTSSRGTCSAFTATTYHVKLPIMYGSGIMKLFIGGDGKIYSGEGFVLSTETGNYYAYNPGNSAGVYVSTPVYLFKEKYPDETWKEIYVDPYYTISGATYENEVSLLALSNSGKLVYMKGGSSTAMHTLIGGIKALNTGQTALRNNNGTLEYWEIDAYDDNGNSVPYKWDYFAAYYFNNQPNMYEVYVHNAIDGKIYSYGGTVGSPSTNFRSNSTTLVSSLQARPATLINNMFTRNNTSWAPNGNITPTFWFTYDGYAQSNIQNDYVSFIGADGKIYAINPKGGNYILTDPDGGGFKKFVNDESGVLNASGKIYIPKFTGPYPTYLSPGNAASPGITTLDTAYPGTYTKMFQGATWNSINIVDAVNTSGYGMIALGSDGVIYNPDPSSPVVAYPGPYTAAAKPFNRTSLFSVSDPTNPLAPKYSQIIDLGPDQWNNGYNLLKGVDGKIYSGVTGQVKSFTSSDYDLNNMGLPAGGNNNTNNNSPYYPTQATDCISLK